MNGSLTGRWQGVLSYPDSLTPVHFEADLHESGGSISGLVREMDDDGRGPMTFTSIIEGSRSQHHVDFRKIYDDFDPVCVVDYSGTVDAECLQISGDWVRLDDSLSGSFVMQRFQQDKQASAEDKEIVSLDRQTTQ